MTLTPLIPRFAEYYRENPTWGSLHIVLDDGNIEDSHVEFCVGYAIENSDSEGQALARILLGLSKSQRGRIGRFAENHARLERA